MGCDIHLIREIKIAGVWHCYSATTVERNYPLFAKMAGVRNRDKIIPITEPKGIPYDMSAVAGLYYNMDPYHNESWFNTEEIRELEDWVESKTGDFAEYIWGFLFGNSYGAFEKGSSSYPLDVEDVRFVFWFDN